MSSASRPASDPIVSRRNRIILAIVLVVLLPVFLILGRYISYRVGNTRAIARLEAKARQRGEPLTLAALAATYPPVPDEENAAVALLEVWQNEEPAFWQAFSAGQRPLPNRVPRKLDPNLPILGSKARPISLTNQLPSASLALAESYLKEQAEQMDALRNALRRPRCRFPIQITDGFDALLPHLSAMKGDAQRFRLEALVATERGETDAAITALTNAARMGNLLATEPLLISQLVRIACLTMALEGAQHLLSRRELAPAELNRLDALLPEFRMIGTLRSVFVAERASSLSVFDTPAASMTKLKDFDHDGPANLGVEHVRIGFLTAIGIAGADRRLMLETFDRAMDLAQEEFPQSLPRYQSLFEQTHATARRYPPKLFCLFLLPALEKVPHRFASLEARRRAAVTALAIQRHRLAHGGKLPDRLEQLVPQFLPAVPIDPYDGQPLRYRRLPTGYVVYSIGADREDNEGKPRPDKGTKGADDSFAVGR